MPRLRKKHLPHRIDTKALLGEGAEGETWADTEPDVPAYVEHKTRLVVDRRSNSATLGQEVTSQTFIVLLPTHELQPRTKVTVWKGTVREREVEVIDSQLFSYNARTPNHVELFCT